MTLPPRTPPSSFPAAAPDKPDDPDLPPATVAGPQRQLALQAAAAFLVLSLLWPYYGMQAQALPWATVSLAIGGVAMLLAALTQQPWWWRVIHALFAPLLWAGLQLAIAPGWFLLAFILLLLVYRGALSEQVPLYLSNPATITAIATQLPAYPVTFVDLGAGIGSSLLPLARQRPECRFVGVENAPLTWAIGWLRTRGQANIDWRWGSLWDFPLHQADLAYAFLSPVPMPELWQKVRQEMRPGTLFLSNTFAVPDATADFVIDSGTTPPRPLYAYRV